MRGSDGGFVITATFILWPVIAIYMSVFCLLGGRWGFVILLGSRGFAFVFMPWNAELRAVLKFLLSLVGHDDTSKTMTRGTQLSIYGLPETCTKIRVSGRDYAHLCVGA